MSAGGANQAAALGGRRVAVRRLNGEEKEKLRGRGRTVRGQRAGPEKKDSTCRKKTCSSLDASCRRTRAAALEEVAALSGLRIKSTRSGGMCRPDACKVRKLSQTSETNYLARPR